MSFIEVHDPDYTKVMSLSVNRVYHVPPRHLAISRLVLCRNFDPKNPLLSCSMGDACKFVHADVDEEVKSHPIHVNYAWKSPDAVSYSRMPAGQVLEVLAPNNRQPIEYIPSHLILQTRATAEIGAEPLSHCAHYYFNRMCNRGDACNFVHAVYVDPHAKEFQRAPPRAGAGLVGLPRPAAATPCEGDCCRAPTPLSSRGSEDLGLSGEDSDACETPARQPVVLYRRNPYSLVEVTTVVVRD